MHAKSFAPQPLSFTIRYPGRTNTLLVEVGILPPIPKEKIDPASGKIQNIIPNSYNAIWDTGATNTVISQKVIDECNLKPIGKAIVHTATDVRECLTFLVSVFLPNKMFVRSLRVTQGSPGNCDVLIGMDIIAAGDFAITHPDGKTTFSFRMPAVGEIDFVTGKHYSPPITAPKVGRNDPCPCGSGKKYKKCCGFNNPS